MLYSFNPKKEEESFTPNNGLYVDKIVYINPDSPPYIFHPTCMWKKKDWSNQYIHQLRKAIHSKFKVQKLRLGSNHVTLIWHVLWVKSYWFHRLDFHEWVQPASYMPLPLISSHIPIGTLEEIGTAFTHETRCSSL